MTAKCSLPYLILTLATLGLLIPASGCQSGTFSKPDFSKLAFWKKQDTVLPPPPARHVDPARFDDDLEMGLESQIAGKSSGGDSLRDRLEIARSGLAERKADSGFSEAKSDEQNGYDLNLAKIRSSMEESANREQTRLTSAQEDFKSAMDSASNAFGGGASEGSNEFEVTPTVYDSSGKLVQQTKNDAADFARKTLAKAQSSANEFQASVSGSMKSGMDQVKNQFEATRDQAAAATKERLAGVSKLTSDAVKNPFPKFDSSKFAITEKQIKESMPNRDLEQLQAELSQEKQEVELLRQQVAARKQKAEQSLLQPKSSSASSLNPQPENNSFGGGFEPAPKPVGNMALSTISPDAGQSAGSSFSPGGALSNLKPIASTPKQNLSAASPSGTIYGSLQPIQQDASDNAKSAESGSESIYPSTPHNGFSKANDLKVQMPGAEQFGLTPQNGVAQVSATQFDGSTAKVAQAGALLPVDSASQNQVGRIQSYVPAEPSKVVNTVGEVDIPAAVLTGKGSYAPGSVNTLKR